MPAASAERLLHDRCGVDEHLHAPPAPRGKLAGDFLEPTFDDIVIVAVPRIDRDRAALALVEHVQRVARRAVIHAQHDDRPHVRPQSSAGRRDALLSRQATSIEPWRPSATKCGEPRRRLRNGIGRGDGDQIEAGLLRLAVDQRPEARRLAKAPAASSEIQIRVVRDRRQAAHPVAEQRAEGGARLQPRVPVLGRQRSRSSRSRRDSRAPRASPAAARSA